MKNATRFRNYVFLFPVLAALFAAGCAPASSGSSGSASPDSSVETETASSSTAFQSADGSLQSSEKQEPSSTLIISYSWPVTGMESEDTNTSASVVMQDGEIEGNTAFAASLIQQETGFDWIELEARQAYPTDYDTLIDQAASEKEENLRPALQEIPDLSGYERIILVTPVWWSDLPMPVYTFLESEDLQEKTILPVVIHGGSRLSGIPEILGTYGHADESQALSISRSALMDSQDEIRQWAADL